MERSRKVKMKWEERRRLEDGRGQVEPPANLFLPAESEGLT